MTSSKDLHVVIIHRLSPKTNYTRQLNEGFRETGNLNSITLYGWKGQVLKSLTNGKGVWTPKLFPFQIFKELIVDKPAIVHLQYEFATFGPLWTNAMLPLLLLLAKMTRSKLVITIHAVVPYSIVNRSFMRNFAPALANLPFIASVTKMLFILLYRLLSRFGQVIYVHGMWYKTALIQYYATNATKIRIVPYGIDDSKDVDHVVRDAYLKLLHNKRSVLFFGSMSPRKDIEGLIRAFGLFSEKHPEHVLVIAGSSTLDFRWYGDHLRKVTKELGLEDNVLFLGFVSDSGIHALYDLSDFVVLPYKYGFEGPSAPLAFAVQHGVPVIGTDVGHFREEISNLKEGILVPVGNQQALSEAMTTLADNPQLRQNLAKNIIKKKSGATWRDVAAETYLEYRNLMLHEKEKFV